MGNFDITKSRSSFFASINKRKRLGLDSDSESDEEDVKRATKAKPSQEKTPESNEASQITNGATQETATNDTDNTQTAMPQHTDIHLASLSQQVQQQLMQMQGLDLKQRESKEAIDLDDEDWLKEVTGGEPSRPPPAPSSANMISLSSDEEEIEPLEESLMAGLDPELQKLVQNRSKVDQAEPNKIDLKIQYVNENDVDEKYRTLLVKLMKPIKIRVMDTEQFDKVLQVFCSKKKLRKDDALLVYKEDKVFLRTTPSGLGMKPNQDYVLHVYPRHVYEAKVQKEKDEREQRFQKRRKEENMMEDLLSNEGEAPPPAEEQEQRMAITLRGKDGKDVHLRAKPTTLLKTLAEHYAKHSGLTDTKNIKVQLDGETLNLNDTVETVGLEDEDLLDVVI